ncbi:MAG: Ig-like domain-containing protein [Chloroflexi bacterium]|nr:Ig-like domain-containing protein [Chloroflexota bacterium]
MRAVVLRSLAVVGIGALILAGVLYLASTVDGRAPSVLAITLTQPLPDDPEVGLPTTSIEIAFTEPVDEASAEAALRIEPDVAGSVSWGGSVMLFTPREPLELASTYTVTMLEGVRDPAGNRMSELPPPFTFATTGPPTLVESLPEDGAAGVALDEPIALRFSGLMDTASVEAALELRPFFPHTLRWSGQVLEIQPTEPLRADAGYRVMVRADAFDASGVSLDAPIRIAFTTLAPGLDPVTLVPADGTDGIARTTPIAVFFEQPIDPDSVSLDLISVTPNVSGSLELLDELGEPAATADDGVILRFTPSGPLPANTTFEVRLEGAIAGIDGGGLAEPLTWTFTTGAPQTALTNRIAFLSERGGVANLWAMNADGTAAHQLSTELTPVLDYAVAPDGSSFVVGDGRRLVMQQADGSDRRVLTDDGFLEFDPAYAPNGQALAFARADATDGSGLGIWERTLPGDSTVALEVPEAWVAGSDDDRSFRAPRYAPDGSALAFVDLAGWVAIVPTDGDDALRVRYAGETPPLWLPDSSGFLLAGRPVVGSTGSGAFSAPIDPLAPRRGAAVVALSVDGGEPVPASFGDGSVALAVGPAGRIVFRDADGILRIADDTEDSGRPVAPATDAVSDASFAPAENALVAVVPGGTGASEMEGALVRIDLGTGRRNVLANDGWHPRWLP